MNNNDKRKLIRTLCNSMRDHLLAQVENMPPEWDGHELRELAALDCERESTLRRRPGQVGNLRRLRQFNRERLRRGIR